MKSYLAAALPLISLACAQQVGKEQSESHPKMTWKKCTAKGSCTNVNGEVVIDANWRWLHETGGFENCYDGNEWTDICSSPTDCAEKCAVEGADYGTTYGISTSGNALTLKFIQKHEYGTNIGSRVYLMNGASKYQMFTLMDNEFAFDIDLSTIECGINSALYFVPMEEDGGSRSYPSNKAGAKYGTGYCDAQCARDLKFVGGKANIEGWESVDENSGIGPYGACCAEIDVWESNAHAFALTPHPCEKNEYHVCETDGCGGTYSEDRFGGGCDANGCDYNPYRMGNLEFYGKGQQVDTSKKFTVVTRFENDKMSQFFVQDGKKHTVPPPQFEGISDSADLTPDLCKNQFQVFKDHDRFNEVGGWPKLNEALRLPMVLVMSIWTDVYANMLWLDSIYPPEREGEPGALRGPCAQDTGDPAETQAAHPNAKVIWSNIRFGPIGSTVEV